MKSRINILIVCVLALSLLYGCAEMDMPTSNTVLKSPMSSGSVKIGMTKTQVLNQYGEPDLKRMVTSKEWGGTREEWYYSARTSLPVGMGYLSESAYLYFDGENLTNIGSKAMGSAVQVKDSSEEFIK